MKNSLFFFIIFLISISLWQCSTNNVPRTVEDVDLIVQSVDGTPLNGASVKVNNDTPVLTDSIGDAGEFDLSTGDSIFFSASGYKPVIIYIIDPILLSGLTVHMSDAAPMVGTVEGNVKFDGTPCGISRIINLDKPTETTNCDQKGNYSLIFSTPNPYRIGFVSTSNEVLKLKIKTDTDTAELDVEMVDSAVEIKKK